MVPPMNTPNSSIRPSGTVCLRSRRMYSIGRSHNTFLSMARRTCSRRISRPTERDSMARQLAYPVQEGAIGLGGPPVDLPPFQLLHAGLRLQGQVPALLSGLGHSLELCPSQRGQADAWIRGDIDSVQGPRTCTWTRWTGMGQSCTGQWHARKTSCSFSNHFQCSKQCMPQRWCKSRLVPPGVSLLLTVSREIAPVD